MKKIPKIDAKKCTLCGSCIEICPQKVIEEKNKRIVVTVDECMICSHCYSVCKFNAVQFDTNILRNPEFNVSTLPKNSPHQGISPNDLISFFRSRRSIRKYSSQKVSREILSDLVEFAVTAPSGSNCQEWEFITVNGHEKVWDLAMEIKKFFIALNRLARNPIIRYLSLLFMGKALINYYRDHMETVEMGLRESDDGRDLLFHSAPSIIIIHSNMEGSTPVEDAQFAAYNMTLLAHSLGMGTCFIGYAVEAINRARKVKEYLDIPFRNRVHAVITIGYTDMEFYKPALRKPISVQNFE